MTDRVPDPRDPQHGDLFEFVNSTGEVTGRCRVIKVDRYEVEWFAGHGPNGAVAGFLPRHYGTGSVRQVLNDRLASSLRPLLGDLDIDQAVADLAADLEAL